MTSRDEIDMFLSSSPPGRLHLAEGSDLFQAVMKEFNIDSGSMFEVRYNRPKKDISASERSNGTDGESRSGTFADKVNTRQKFEREHNRVRWMDEDLNKPLTMEITEDPRERLHSFSKSGEPKPILKHKATCIVIISDN
ncbi:hypothetical protein CHS0354_011007 [Potamilus streckersoni]|uniref:Uncharacterized protein n=1 Tax=Potamilus streckersoni TaxID=2493646 RepID=A0AAE0TM32_9BIVA|nr:hypothetical protein CHS0354_011007 [Potamilus streckersoni]